MKKIFFSLALVFSANVMSADFHAMIETNYQLPTKKSLDLNLPYPSLTSSSEQYLRVEGMQITGFSEEGRKKMDDAFRLLEEVVNSEEFKQRILNFKNNKGERKFNSNNNLSNEEIYKTFMEGRETLQPNTPGEMNFYLKLYNKSWSKVIGYTSANTNVININWKYFKNFKPSQVASNLAHEWTHKLGFGHRSASENDSAPYAIGNIVEELAQMRPNSIE